jgi:hypothetical protein
MSPIANRLGYTVSSPIYLPNANGFTVTVTGGQASIYAGMPNAASHRFVASLSAGESHDITGLATGEVISLQHQQAFTFTATPPSGDPPPPPCTDPTTCDEVSSIRSVWRCNTPGCVEGDWEGGVVAWPSWAAYESNNRLGSNSRTVYSLNGDVLYPYMGAWASGCRVTAVTGPVLVIEWQRGTESWRATRLESGQTHVIQLTSPEDNAMIETPDTPTDFVVSLENCTPQVVPKP